MNSEDFKQDGDGLCADSIGRCLTTKVLGRRLEILESVDSTNLYIKRKLLDAIDGLTVASDLQTHGYGRRNRAFHSPSGGIYMSVLLKLHLKPEDIQFLTVCTAVSVCRALEEVCGLKTDIKWVNDVYHNGKKLCGISTETLLSLQSANTEHVLIGIGINTGDVPKEVESIATSILKATGKIGFRNRLIATVLNHLEFFVEALCSGGKQKLLTEYKSRLFIIGKNVTVHCPVTGDYQATVNGLDDTASLIVTDSQGTTHFLRAGEVSLKI